MSEHPENRRKIDISPELLWNSMGMIQQAVMVGVMLIVYVIISLSVIRTPGSHPGLEGWLSSLHGLFSTTHLLRDVLFGLLAGAGAVLVTSILDMLIGVIGKYDLRDWMMRSDYLLPITPKQKRWALAISLTGSIQEEIMFRGFIYIALISLWSHWLWAALILSAFFSLLHAGVQDSWSTIWIFLISVILCASVTLGGSIYLVAVAHVVINISNLFILPMMFKKRDE